MSCPFSCFLIIVIKISSTFTCSLIHDALFFLSPCYTEYYSLHSPLGTEVFERGIEKITLGITWRVGKEHQTLESRPKLKISSV